MRLPISTRVGVSVIRSPNFLSGLDWRCLLKSVGVLFNVLGLVALLTLTLLAMPTVAVCALLPTTFAFRWLVVLRITGFSDAGFSKGSAESGGERIVCRFWSGEETSRGAVEGCEESAEAAVTRGCLRETERPSDVVEMFADADADLGFGRNSQSGSCDSTCAFHAFVWVGVVRATTIVTDSLSEMSKLFIEDGVGGGRSGLRLGEPLYWRVKLVEGGLFLSSSAPLNVGCVGDFAGAVLERARGESDTSGDGARKTGVPARSVGVPARNVGVARPVAGNKDNRADGGLETVGDVALRGSLGGARFSLSSLSTSVGVQKRSGEMA